MTDQNDVLPEQKLKNKLRIYIHKKTRNESLLVFYGLLGPVRQLF